MWGGGGAPTTEHAIDLNEGKSSRNARRIMQIGAGLVPGTDSSFSDFSASLHCTFQSRFVITAYALHLLFPRLNESLGQISVKREK